MVDLINDEGSWNFNLLNFHLQKYIVNYIVVILSPKSNASKDRRIWPRERLGSISLYSSRI